LFRADVTIMLPVGFVDGQPAPIGGAIAPRSAGQRAPGSLPRRERRASRLRVTPTDARSNAPGAAHADPVVHLAHEVVIILLGQSKC